jgi:hypothetical protein
VRDIDDAVLAGGDLVIVARAVAGTADRIGNAEPALDADDAKLSACAGALQAAANRVRHSVRERIGKVMELFHLASRTLLWYKPLRRMTIGQSYRV